MHRRKSKRHSDGTENQGGSNAPAARPASRPPRPSGPSDITNGAGPRASGSDGAGLTLRFAGIVVSSTVFEKLKVGLSAPRRAALQRGAALSAKDIEGMLGHAALALPAPVAPEAATAPGVEDDGDGSTCPLCAFSDISGRELYNRNKGFKQNLGIDSTLESKLGLSSDQLAYCKQVVWSLAACAKQAQLSIAVRRDVVDKRSRFL